MEDFKRKKKIRKVLYSRSILVALLVLIVLMIRANWNVYQKSRQSESYLQNATRELTALEDQYEVLSQEESKLKTERGIEEEIRRKYNVAKSGEQVFVIVDKKETEEAEVEVEKSWWQNFIDFFKTE